MKRNKEVLISLGGKILALAARELVPFVLSILVRSGIRKYTKERKEQAEKMKKPQTS